MNCVRSSRPRACRSRPSRERVDYPPLCESEEVGPRFEEKRALEAYFLMRGRQCS